MKTFYYSTIYIYLLLLSFTTAFSQRQLIVVDIVDQEPMPFVKIYPNVGSPTFTDIDGKGLISNEASVVKLTFSGYRDTTVNLTDQKSIVVQMTVISKEINEVVILPGINPALRIINHAIENRKKNHPLANDAFTYESYSKFVIDLDSSFSSSTKDIQTDSTVENSEILNLIKKQHLFLMESASERKFIPPARDRENIIAYKVSGISSPILSTFAQSLQSFHFYDNQFDLLGIQYLNPIAFGSTKKYYYLLEDTTVVGSDTTFMISFRPQPNSSFDGMIGVLFINTNGWAIEKVIAEPFKENGSYVKIVQEYKLIDGKKWFPIDLKTKVEMKSAAIQVGENKGFLEGYGNTYIKNIVLNPDGIKKSGFGNVALSTEVNAGEVTENKWQELRKDTLSDRELTTYQVLDSVAKEANLDKKLEVLSALTTGKLRMGYVSLPLDRIVNYNLYEGFRLGAGLETSNRVSKHFVIGGYFAWGTKDKDWKYGGYSTIHINRRLGMSLELKYQQDLLHRGSNKVTKTTWDLTSASMYTNLFQKYMDRQQLAQLTYTVAPLGNLTMHLSANYQRLNFTQNYLFINDNNLVFDKQDFAETSFEMNWNIRQRIILIGDIRKAQPTVYPKIRLKVTKGWSGIGEATTDYLRLFASVNEDIKSIRFGTLNLHLEGSQTLGDVPLALRQNAIGTNQQFSIVTTNVFETVFPGEFYHDRQASFIVRYTFPKIKTKSSVFKPEFALHHGIGYGDMANKLQHTMYFSTMDKGLYEGGLIMNGVLNIRLLQIGVGVFYRYGYYSDKDVLNNFVPKISLKVIGLD